MNQQEEQNLIIKTMARLEINKTLIELRALKKANPQTIDYRYYLKVANNLSNLCDLCSFKDNDAVQYEIKLIKDFLLREACMRDINLYTDIPLDESIFD